MFPRLKQLEARLARSRAWTCTWACLAILLATLTVPALSAAPVENDLRVAKLKAAFVLNFVKYTEWPAGAFASSDSPIVIGVVGDEVLAGVMRMSTEGLLIEGRPLLVKSYPAWEPAASGAEALEEAMRRLGKSHVVHMAGSIGATERWSGGMARRGVLTIGEGHDAVREGALLGLCEEDGRLVFHAATDEIRRSGLEISSRLLRLSR